MGDANDIECMRLKLSSATRTALSLKYSGRKLDDTELRHSQAAYDRISNGDLLPDEEDDSLWGTSPDPEVEAQVAVRQRQHRDLPPVPTIFVREDLCHNKQTWRRLYEEKGLGGLAEAVMKEEIEQRLTEKKALYFEDMEWSAVIMNEILLSTDGALLESILYGNLALDRLKNPKLEATLVELGKQAEHQPGIYYQYLVSKRGQSPSAHELQKVCDYMMGYLKGCGQPGAKSGACIGVVDHKLANKIDNFRRSKKNQVTMVQSQSGYRNYLNTRPSVDVDDNNNPISKERAWKRKRKLAQPAQKKYVEQYSSGHFKEIAHFAQMLRTRLASVPSSERDAPLQYPLLEIGYSKRCIDRLKQHARHDSSNYIMNLAESICAVAEGEGDFNALYWIHQAVIYLIWSPEQAEISEIGFTKLAEGYIHNAGGFSHFPAGLSNHSANKIPAREWDSAKEYLVSHSVYPENLKAQTGYLEGAVVLKEGSVERKRQRDAKHMDSALTALRGPDLNPSQDSSQEGRAQDFAKSQVVAVLNRLRSKASANVGALNDLVVVTSKTNAAVVRIREGAVVLE